MEIRFRLHDESDAALIARIKEKANGGGENNAARFLLRHWYENERMACSPAQGLEIDATASNKGMSDEDLTKALDIIDRGW